MNLVIKICFKLAIPWVFGPLLAVGMLLGIYKGFKISNKLGIAWILCPPIAIILGLYEWDDEKEHSMATASILTILGYIGAFTWLLLQNANS